MPRRIPAFGPARRQAGAVAAIVTAALCAGAAVSPSPAGAAGDIDPPDMTRGQLSTQQVVMPATGTAAVRVRVHLSDPQGVAIAVAHAMAEDFPEALLGALERGEDPGDFEKWFPAPAQLRLVDGTVYDGIWAGTIRIRRTNLPGSYTVGLSAMDRNDNMAASMEFGHFRARYGTAVRADIASETVAKGDAVTVSGRLAQVTPTGWAPLAQRRVAVQFRADGAQKWTTKGTLLTGADGTFANATRFHAQHDGAWRVQFNGGRTYAPAASAADSVDVS